MHSLPQCMTAASALSLALRSGLRSGLWAACLSLAACSGQGPSVVLATPNGLVSPFSPAPVMPGGQAPPPPGMQAAPPIPAPAANLDGTYGGTASVLMGGGGQCLGNHQVRNFVVRGNQARWSGFRGRIDPDGETQMHFGQTWIVGQFEGATFHGQLSVGGWGRGPGCTYLLTLERVGP